MNTDYYSVYLRIVHDTRESKVKIIRCILYKNKKYI